jgi:hypothetical protein
MDELSIDRVRSRERARGSLNAFRAARQFVAACTTIEEALACLDAMVDGAALRSTTLERGSLAAALKEYVHG